MSEIFEAALRKSVKPLPLQAAEDNMAVSPEHPITTGVGTASRAVDVRSSAEELAALDAETVKRNIRERSPEVTLLVDTLVRAAIHITQLRMYVRHMYGCPRSGSLREAYGVCSCSLDRLMAETEPVSIGVDAARNDGEEHAVE